MASLEFDIGLDCSPEEYVPDVISKVSSMVSTVKSKIGGKSSGSDAGYDTMSVFVILRDFMQPDAPHSHEVYSLGIVCVDMAEQIPYHHPSQHKMVRLLEYLGESAKVNEKYYTTEGRLVCYRYPKLGEYVKDEQNYAPDEECPEEYVNLHAFLARLDQCHVFRTDPWFAVCAMLDAFEETEFEKTHEDKPAGVRDALIMGAAQWILWNGQDLFIQLRYPGDKEPKNPHGHRYGVLDDADEPALRLDRWHIWRDGFRAVAGEKHEGTKECKAVAGEKYEPSGECKAGALRAADMMDAFEKNMSF